MKTLKNTLAFIIVVNAAPLLTGLGNVFYSNYHTFTEGYIDGLKFDVWAGVVCLIVVILALLLVDRNNKPPKL